MADLIELQKAYATQLTGTNGKGEWVVYNEKQEEIARLPSNFDEHQVMAAIRLGRKFELIAFNTGIFFERERLNNEITGFKNQIKVLADENTRLSNKLQTLIFNE